jgi:hypothetical protein
VIGVLSQTVRMHPMTDGTRDAGRRALRRTVLIALAFSAASAASWFAFEDAPAVFYVLGGSGFHVGWWMGALPLLRRDSPTIAAERAVSAPPSRRVASLVARDDESILPRRFWVLPIAALVVSAAMVAWAAADGRVTWGGRAWIVGNLWFGGLLFLAGWGCWALAAGRAKQDLSTAADPSEVDRLCRDFRRFMVRSLFVGTTLAVVLFAGGAGALALWGDREGAGRIGGWLGGGGGSLLGVLGGVFGLLADRRRRAIIELGGVPPDAVLGRRSVRPVAPRT